MTKFVHPGGESGKRRIRYSMRRKYGLLATVRRLRWEGRLLKSIASELRVGSSNLSRWEQQKVGEMDPKDKLFKKKKLCSHPGPPSQLAAIDESLLRYVFEQREQGIVVDTIKIVLRALFLSPEFREKSLTAHWSAVLRWVHAHSMSY